MITFIGAGNVAWHLSPALEKAGFEVDAVYSRTLESGEEVASLLYNTEVTNDLDFSESQSELFIIAVPDDAILEVARKLVLPDNAILVHTSGTFPLEELQATVDTHHDLPVDCGVFYPLMTFTKGKKVTFDDVPLCIEGIDEPTERYLIKIAKKISRNVQAVSTEERRILHLSAVFACNFTNHLWAVSQEIMEANDLDFKLLKPLIKETFQKAMTAPVIAEVQTGPAIRGDKKTIAAHLELLSEDPDLTKVYELLTKNIQTFFE